MILAMIRRDFLTARSYRFAFALDSVFGVLNLLIYYFISKTLGPISVTGLQGAPNYFAFAAVGASMTIVIQSATAGLARRVREEQLTGTMEALVAHPISAGEIALGLAGFPFLFAIVRAAIYILLAGSILGMSLAHTNWPGFGLILLLSGTAFCAIGVVLAGVVVAVKRGEGLIALTTFGLSFLGGAVFPRSVLPDWAATLGSVTPTRFAFDGVRNVLFLGEGWAGDALVLAAFSLLAIPAGIAIFHQALLAGRRSGSLAEY